MKIEPEIRDDYEAWRADWNKPENNAKMLKHLAPYVRQSIIAAGGDPREPILRAKANLLAISYLRRYDPEASSIKNFLYGQMRGLYRVVGQEGNIMQMPERAVLGKKALEAAERDLLDTLGRVPSTAELADATGLPIKQIKKLRSANLPKTESAAYTNPSDGAFNYATTRHLGQNKADEAWQEYVYDSLPDRSRVVMENLYGMHGLPALSPGALAKKLKISQAAISQHRKKIESMLADDARYALFGG